MIQSDVQSCCSSCYNVSSPCTMINVFVILFIHERDESVNDLLTYWGGWEGVAVLCFSFAFLKIQVCCARFIHSTVLCQGYFLDIELAHDIWKGCEHVRRRRVRDGVISVCVCGRCRTWHHFRPIATGVTQIVLSSSMKSDYSFPALCWCPFRWPFVFWSVNILLPAWKINQM